MSLFTDTVKQDTPRLVVMYKCGDDGSPMFQWGIVGTMPLVTLIGSIVEAQHIEWAEKCPEPAAVFAWDASKKEFTFFYHEDIPWTALVGMLEVIKITLISTHTARSMANQQVILGPDGSPINGQARPIRRI